MTMIKTARKERIKQQSDKLASVRNAWVRRNSYFYEKDRSYMRFLIPEGARVLELGCGWSVA